MPSSSSSSSSSPVHVLVLGAAGVVGVGVCDAWLKEGATVIAVDQNQTDLTDLRRKLLSIDDDDNGRLMTVVGDLSSVESATTLKTTILTLLGSSGQHQLQLQHIVTTIGCSVPAPTGGGLTSVDAVQRIKDSYDTVFYPNLIATNVFLDLIRNVPGASFTVAGGPFTHHCPNKELYNVSLMGATFNHFGTILAAETKDTPCRGNTLCCHFSIGFPDDINNKESSSSSSFGPLLDEDFGPVSDTREWGKAFVRLANGTERVGFICMHDPEEVKVLVQSKEWMWFPDQHKFGPAPPL